MLCPFGWTVYCYKSECADLDDIFQRCLLQVVLHRKSKLSKNDNFLYVWPQYFRDLGNSNDIILNKSRWSVKPTVIIMGHRVKLSTFPHNGKEDSTSQEYHVMIFLQKIQNSSVMWLLPRVMISLPSGVIA